MKIKLLLSLFLFVSQFSFSQTERLLKGTVVSSDNFLLENVDVINKTSQKSTKTNENGEFTIAVKANDSLLFYAKDYYLKRVKLSNEQIGQNNLQVVMVKKPEELEEVIIRAMSTTDFLGSKEYVQAKRDELKVAKSVEYIKKRTVYEGEIDNGMDFKRIGEMIFGLFMKEKEPTNEKAPETEFSVLAKSICEEKFYLETLKLKPEEIDLFLQFCATDPKSKAIIKNHNVLSMMDFLMAKNIEFRKFNSSAK